MTERRFDNLNERLDFIEFRQQLLFDNSDLSRFLFECQIVYSEYVMIMKLMDELENKIKEGMHVKSTEFEQRVYKIVPYHQGDYHFCEGIAMLFYKDGRWRDVILTLYGESSKFAHIFAQ